MNQNFSFMEKMVPLIISGRKIITNRTASEFRGKCNVGDTMYIFTGMQTDHCKRIGTAKVIERVFWKYRQIPKIYNYHEKSPLGGLTWRAFSYRDGFNYYANFKEYFKNHKNRDLGFYCYKFEFNVGRDLG